MRAEREATSEQRARLAARLIVDLRASEGKQGDNETRRQGEGGSSSIPSSSRPSIPSSFFPARERFILFAAPLVRAILGGQKTVTRRPVAGNRPPTTHCPFGVAGDVLWVREKWGYRDEFFSRAARGTGGFVYAADGTPEGAKFLAWRPSLHMRRAAGRIELRVTASRAERLTCISEAHALAEGCPTERRGEAVAWFRETWDGYYAGQGLGWDGDPWVWVVEFEVGRHLGR